MKIKLIGFFIACELFVSGDVNAQANATTNTLTSSATATSIQSTPPAGYKLAVQGPVKVWGVGTITTSANTSPSFLFDNRTASTGRKYYLTSGNTGLFQLYDSTAGNLARFTLDAAGNIGIGTTSPAAVLHLKPGTATAGTAPFKFTSGVNVATPEAGAFEYDGTSLYFTPTAGNRKTVAFTDMSNASGVLSLGNGGTGQTTANASLNALLPAQTGNNGKVLQSDGTNASWVALGAGSQTPWTSNIDGGQYNLSNVKKLNVYKNVVAGENLLLYSEVLSNTGAWGTGNFSITDNQAADMDGNMTLDEVTSNWTSSNGVSQTITVSPNTSYTISWDVKRKSGGITDVNYSVYNFSNFTYIISPSSYYSATGSSVSRVQFSFTTPAGCNSIKISPFAEINATGSIYIGRVQLSTNPASGYLTTTGSAASGGSSTVYALSTDDNGNVGMGTITPSQKLEVVGNIKISGALMPGNNAGTAGQVLTSAGPGAAPVWATASGGGNTAWSLAGNGSTNPGTDFIGTTDDKDVVFKRNNIISGLVGSSNTSFGAGTLQSNTTGGGNIAFGTGAGQANTTGNYNTFVGFQSGLSNTTGVQNTFIGRQSGASNTSGWSNVFLGTITGYYNTTGSKNTFLGDGSGYATSTGYENTFTGYGTGSQNTSGYYNTFLGALSGEHNTTGSMNTFLGQRAGSFNLTGQSSTFVGFEAGLNATGSYNTFLGHYSGHYSTSGVYNLFLGAYAAQDNTTGMYNTVLGSNSGGGITTGNYNTIIGANVNNLSSSLSNNIIIADGQGNRRINVDETGNAGIGTVTPLSRLHVKGTNAPLWGIFSVQDQANSGNNGQAFISFMGADNNRLSYFGQSYAHFVVENGVGNGAIDLAPVNGNVVIGGNFVDNGTKLQVNGNAFISNKIGIGIVNTLDDYKLAVAGNIIAEKVKVKLHSSWPDYVFQPDYKLPSLPQLEAFIRTHHHLPEVPSVEDVKKNGIDLGDNQSVLLKKIEELTLYIIEQSKKSAEQQDAIIKLQQQISELKTSLQNK